MLRRTAPYPFAFLGRMFLFSATVVHLQGSGLSLHGLNYSIIATETLIVRLVHKREW